VRGHEDHSVLGERDEQALEFVFGVALDEQRDRRGHVELMLDRTVDAGDASTEQRADRELNLPRWAAGTLVVGVEFIDRERTVEDLLVAPQSLQGSSVLEHQVRVD
jgi:hypothetical protein